MDLVTPGIGLFFWQLITFLLLFFLLSRFAWKPIMASLRERESSIENAIQSAETARQEMKALQAQNENLLQEARIERDAMLKKATATAETLVEEARQKAAVEGNRLVEEARKAIGAERQAALESIRQQVAELSVEIAEKLLRRQLANPEAQKQLVDQLIAENKLN